MSLLSNTNKLLSNIFANKSNNKGTLVAFNGSIGAGKTTLIQSLAKKFSIKETLTSPTFVLRKDYPVPNTNQYYKFFKNIVHIDLYRDSDTKTLKLIELDKAISTPNTLIFVEWFENIKSKHIKPNLTVECSIMNEEHIIKML